MVKPLHSRKCLALIVLRVLAYLLGSFGLIGTLLPFLRYDDYWIRGFDYPRLQLFFILLFAAGCWAVTGEDWGRGDDVVLALLLLAAAYQLYRILPYTRLWPVQSQAASQQVTPATSLSLMVSNVLQTNDAYDKVIDLVLNTSPDIFLSLESNEAWGKALRAGLDTAYPYAVEVPQENLYGMHLFSRIALIDPEVKYRIREDIPSIDARVKLGNGEEIDLYFLHPMPPSPSEAYASTGRDAELAMVGREVGEKGRQAIVAGDMNDVAWSHSSRLFQRLSGLLDPRRGRGFYATFHADHWLARWPLDHVFHAPNLALVNMRRLPHIGSDHFPLFIHFNFEQGAAQGNDNHQNEKDKAEAETVIEHGKNGKEDVLVEGKG